MLIARAELLCRTSDVGAASGERKRGPEGDKGPGTAPIRARSFQSFRDPPLLPKNREYLAKKSTALYWLPGQFRAAKVLNSLPSAELARTVRPSLLAAKVSE